MDKFWDRVERGGEDECWPWKGWKDKNGYGRLGVGGRQHIAHRYAFFLHHGRWAKPFTLHRCDNPPCCNPAHLFEGTQADNMADMAAKGRWRKGQKPADFHGPRGERQHKAVLTVEKVHRIRQLANAGMPRKEIALVIGCKHSAVADVLMRRTWTWVE